MRYFLAILLSVSSFFALAQDVVIPADVARYFLEQDDRANILHLKDSVSMLTILNLDQELRIKNEIIKSYKKDSLIFRSIIVNKDQQISLGKEELVASSRMINNQKFEVSLFAGASTGAVIGSAIPVIGTIGGAVIGAGTGCVVYGIGKVKYLFKHK